MGFMSKVRAALHAHNGSLRLVASTKHRGVSRSSDT
jgi:hypothetical protein